MLFIYSAFLLWTFYFHILHRFLHLFFLIYSRTLVKKLCEEFSFIILACLFFRFYFLLLEPIQLSFKSLFFRRYFLFMFSSCVVRFIFVCPFKIFTFHWVLLLFILLRSFVFFVTAYLFVPFLFCPYFHHSFPISSLCRLAFKITMDRIFVVSSNPFTLRILLNDLLLCSLLVYVK